MVEKSTVRQGLLPTPGFILFPLRACCGNGDGNLTLQNSFCILFGLCTLSYHAFVAFAQCIEAHVPGLIDPGVVSNAGLVGKPSLLELGFALRNCAVGCGLALIRSPLRISNPFDCVCFEACDRLRGQRLMLFVLSDEGCHRLFTVHVLLPTKKIDYSFIG